MDIGSQYFAKPFEMTSGEWTINSPAPTLNTGKVLTAFAEVQGLALDAVEAGEQLQVEQVKKLLPQTDVELMHLVLGKEQVEELTERGCPAEVLLHAAMCATYYWAYGGSEAAVEMYLASFAAFNGDELPKDELMSRVRSLTGQPME